MSVKYKDENGVLQNGAGLYKVTAPIGMADIYSTEEKEVGLWIDKKPLYQRTLIINGVTQSQNTTVDLATLSDIDHIQVIGATGLESGVVYAIPEFSDRIQFNVSTGKLQSTVPANAGWANATLTITIQYTKTTDTPWSGKFVPQGYGYVSSGDIYSFEERQIGVYADGKPLYQKTVDLGSDVTISYNSWTSLTNSDIPISDIENLVSVTGLGSAGGSYGSLMAGVASSGTALNIQTGRNGDNVFVRYITLQYTKTTDVAGSGEYVPSGDKAEHYSTDEEVIGTWLGETLYRKVINLGNMPNNSSKAVAHGISNFKAPIQASGYMTNGTDNTLIPFCTVGNINYQIGLEFNSTNVVIYAGMDRSAFTGVIFLEYTKTS